MPSLHDDDSPWFGPEPGRDTTPLHSPYPTHAPGSAPPPSQPPPTIGGWQANDLVNDVPPPHYQYHSLPPRPLSPRLRPRRRSAGAIIGGGLLAIALVVVVGVGIALAQKNLNLNIDLGGGPTSIATVATATVAPITTTVPTATIAPTTTSVPTATATLAPTATATMTVTSQVIPPAPPGFGPYLDASNVWGLNIPTGTPISNTSVSTPLGTIPQTTFHLDAQAHDARFDAFTLPAPVPENQAQTLLNQLAQALHASDIVIDTQGTARIGQNTWQTLQIHATLNGNQHIEAYLFYSTHGTGAVAINMSAPVTGFDQANQQAFAVMISSFTYLTR